MSSDTVLQFTEAGKSYPPQRTPLIQLWNQLRGHQGTAQGSFHALKPLSLQVNRGQSLGIVGLNGAGKSTLLQLAAGAQLRQSLRRAQARIAVFEQQTVRYRDGLLKALRIEAQAGQRFCSGGCTQQ